MLIFKYIIFGFLALVIVGLGIAQLTRPKVNVRLAPPPTVPKPSDNATEYWSCLDNVAAIPDNANSQN